MKSLSWIMFGVLATAILAGCGEKAEDPATDKAFQDDLAKAAASHSGPAKKKGMMGSLPDEVKSKLGGGAPSSGGSSAPASAPGK